MSPPLPISVLTTQTALRNRQNIICKSLPPFQNFAPKRQKQPLRWLLISHQLDSLVKQQEVAPLSTYFSK